MITNMPVNSYRQRHPWGTFPTFFAPCSSWGNNDKVMKQSRRLFGVCVQINKSSGALRFEAKRACTQQCRDIEGGKKNNDSNNIYHNYGYSFMSSSSLAGWLLTGVRLVCFGEFIPFHTAGVRLRTTSLYLLMPHLSAELIWTRSLRGEDTHSLISCLCARADQ